MKFFKLKNQSITLFLILSAFAVTTVISASHFDSVFAEYFEAEMSEDGNYITMTSNIPKTIDELTISSWITPDFSEGSSQMTIVSRANAYALGLEQGDEGTKIIFTIFDGMKWQTAESTVKVNEALTHVAATFGDSSINAYINGKQVATLSDITSLTLSERGNPQQTLIESISSDSDDVVGAFVTEKRGTEKVTREFGGIIHVVDLYNNKYDGQGIQDLFDSSFEVQKFSEAEEVAPEIQDFNDNGVVLVSSGTTSTTELLLSSNTNNNDESSQDKSSILDDILENFMRIAEKFTSLYGN